MAGLLPKPAFASLLVLVSGVPGLAAAQVAAPPGIDLSAESFTYHGETSKVDFRGLKISQDDLAIAAERATADPIDFEHGKWQLSGNVRISVDSAKISSNEALLMIENNELATVELKGNPATFEETAPGNTEPVQGHANRLFFDKAKQTLSLTGDAFLRVGGNEIMSCDLIFDLDEQTFSSGTTDCGEPVRIRPSSTARAGQSEAGEDAPAETTASQ